MGKGGFQGGEHLSPNAHKAKLDKVGRIVEGVTSFRSPRG